MLTDELKELFADAYTQGHKDGCNGLYLCPYFVFEQLMKAKKVSSSLTKAIPTDDENSFH